MYVYMNYVLVWCFFTLTHMLEIRCRYWYSNLRGRPFWLRRRSKTNSGSSRRQNNWTIIAGGKTVYHISHLISPSLKLLCNVHIKIYFTSHIWPHPVWNSSDTISDSLRQNTFHILNFIIWFSYQSITLQTLQRYNTTWHDLDYNVTWRLMRNIWNRSLGAPPGPDF